MNVIRSVAVDGFRALARLRRIRGMHRLAFFLYDPFSREVDYKAFVSPYERGLIQIDTRSFIEWWIYMYGSFEGAAIDLLRDLSGTGRVVFDVGANIGVFTLPLAEQGACVHAFEPHPRLRARLVENLALNNLRNTKVSEVAFGDRAGEAILFGAVHANQGQASLFRHADDAESIVCKIETLDHYVEQTRLDRVDLIKIDVEGAELQVLRGAAKTLALHKPCLYVEVNPGFLARFGSSAQELGEFLRELGYVIWRNDVVERVRFGPKRSLARVTDTWPTDYKDHYWLAVHPDSVSVNVGADGLVVR